MSNPHYVHNGSTIFDDGDPTQPSEIVTHRNGARTTIDPRENSDVEFRMDLERMSGGLTAVFDADYSVTATAHPASGATTRNLPDNQIPAELRSDRITPDTLDKAAWKGIVFIEDSKAMAVYFYNMRTGQQGLTVDEDNVNSLVGGENFDIVVRYTVTVHTMVVGGEDVLDRFFNDAATVNSYRQQGVEVAGNTLTQTFTYRFIGAHDSPQSRDATIDARGDIALTGRFDKFLVSHFQFMDNDDGHRLVRLEILRTPDHGRLTVERPSEEPVPVGVIGRIAREDIVHLVYTPHGVPMDDSFEFRVSDGFASGGHHTATLDVV